MWYDLSVRKRPDGEELVADVHVPAGSGWFDGHFPGNPVLPGVAQLNMVYELIGKALGRAVIVREISRVRFKQMVLPDEHLAVFAAPRPEQQGVYAFRITKHDKVVCSGNMTISAANR